VLDLFGGSGQLALEALSRGAEFAVINDASREAANIIKENAQKTKLMPQCRILSADWKEYIRMAKGREQFDLILLDPPYTPGLLDEILAALLEAGLPSENAIIICESDEQGIPAPLEGYRQKLHRYGKSYVTVYRREEEEA
jgi:16S rRNA (guanine(966)-N(2))-methyltransferase RsmD